MILFIVMILTILFLFYSGTSQETLKTTCDGLNKPHKWVERDNLDGNHYLVCKECKMLPGGNMEESNGL